MNERRKRVAERRKAQTDFGRPDELEKKWMLPELLTTGEISNNRSAQNGGRP
jgi:hypothetical protein